MVIGSNEANTSPVSMACTASAEVWRSDVETQAILAGMLCGASWWAADGNMAIAISFVASLDGTTLACTEVAIAYRRYPVSAS